MATGKSVWILLVLAQTGFGLVVNPSENQWVTPGDEASLSCKTSAPIHSCSWETPYGTLYPLEKDIVAEGGRLAGFDDGSGESCGVVVRAVEAKDAGDWRCHISVVSGGEAHPGDAKVSLHIATRPDSVSVLNNIGKLLEAIKEANGGKVVSPVTCVVGKADPKPAFEWFLGSERLKNAQTQDVRNEEDGSWSQILSYEPEASHHNQTLRCKVSHVGFQKGDLTEAETGLLFDEEALNFLRKGIVEQEVSTHLHASIYPVVGVVIFIVVVSLVLVCFHHKRMTWFGCRTYMERRQSVERRGGNPGTPPSSNCSETANEDPEGQGASEQRKDEHHVPTSWLKRCLEGNKAKKVLDSSSFEEATVPAEKVDVPEDVVVEVRFPSPEKEKAASEDQEERKADVGGQGSPEVPVVQETVASEVKGRFRMFKWMKKVPKSDEPFDKTEKADVVEMEKAAEEEMGEKGSPPNEEEETKDKDHDDDKAADSPASPSAKNTAV